ncbi:hypothetical protein D9619_009427 [Psilocybe cf. subviscida]|uniref:F-box domain-containing protein n=1 Tax=Psilocybe cf. subviscida TaxID=2480587 RepID=A0A8H5BWE4_9AGAR|nr:hypothetical protein D9619_009427 [Psilocybe cf. subviscida]
MHAALRINDILREIFIYIQEDEDSNKTAYRAAFVCKQFLPHALDVLWFSVETLGPLIALIPYSTTTSTSLSFTTLLNKEDLSIFDLHARRVKELSLPTKHLIGVPVMMNLLDSLGRSSLLPNLRKLSLGAHALTLSESDCFLLCSSLKYLTIQGKGISFLLPRIAQAAPSIQHLESLYESIPPNLISFLKHLRLLKSLRTKNEFIISPASFPSSFPFAEYLTTWSASSIVLCHDDTVLPGGIEFPSLTTLELTEPVPAGELVALFSRSVFPKLQVLTFCAPPYDEESENPEDATAYKTSWLNLFPLLFKKRHCLQFLHIKGDGYFDYRREETEMDLGDFFADVEWQTLRIFWLDEPKLIKPLTLTSIDRLCTKFPFLSNFRVYLPTSTRISFDDLAVLVDRLPLLYCLNISINGANLADPPSVPILSHYLKTLCIEESDIPDPFLFARYIDRLFPCAVIQEVEYPSEEEELLISAHKLVRGCRKDQEERSKQKPIRKKQTARRGRA